VRSESGDSSLHLGARENALGKPEIAVLLEHGTPSITLQIEGKWQRLIVDTGSNVSILQPVVSRRDLRDYSLRPVGVTGDSLDVKGRSFPLRWEDGNLTISFWYGPSNGSSGTHRQRLREDWGRN